MKLWVDDERHPPDGSWQWATNSADAVRWLQDACVAEISLDHDLGGMDTTRPVVTFMCLEEIWPQVIYVHTANPVGGEWLMGTCQRYAPETTRVSRRYLW